MTQTDWDKSTAAWLAHLSEDGDRGRKYVLDAPMMATVRDTCAKTALDVGGGEGRFCRMMATEGVQTTGIDPTQSLLDAAKAKHADGSYEKARAEALPFTDDTFDLTVSYVALIDIPGHTAAISEMARVTRPGGHVLISNLQPNATARHREATETDGGWIYEGTEPRYYALDDALQERSFWAEWSGIRIKQYHRPLSAYMQAFLGAGLTLISFSEPPFIGGTDALRDRYNRMPWFHKMLWRKPLNT
jgi:2-polyprenyl-3-methyl-5-hydroxy-6-metoxy-1,4-benzoquinol methylase